MDASEHTAAEAQRRLDSALIAGEVGTFEWDVLNDRLWGDPNFARIFSISLDETGAAPLKEYLAALHPDDREGVYARVQDTVETGRDYEAEYRIITNGQTRARSCPAWSRWCRPPPPRGGSPIPYGRARVPCTCGGTRSGCGRSC